MQKLFLFDLHKRVKWTKYGDIGDPWMETRDAYDTATVYLEDTGNNLVSQGWNPFHGCEVPEAGILTITKEDQDIIDCYKLKLNDKFYEFEDRLDLCVTGDDASNIPNVPVDVISMRFVWLTVLSHEPHLYHANISGLPILIAAKKPGVFDENFVVKEIQRITYKLGQSGFIKYYYKARKVWCCMEYKVWNNADWVFVHSNFGGTAGVGATYKIPEIVKVDTNGKLTNLNCLKISEYYDCLTGVFIEPYKIENFSDLLDIIRKHNNDPNNVNDQWTHVYTMNRTDIAYLMVAPIDAIIKKEKETALKNGVLMDYLENQERPRRMELAKLLEHGILYFVLVCEWFCRFDIAHYLWTFVVTLLTVWVMVMWCVWNFTLKEIETILSFLGVPNVVQQYVKQLGKNLRRRIKFAMKINTTGNINKQLLNGFPFAILAAMITVSKPKYSVNPNQQRIMIFVMSVLWFFCKKMRRVFYILFKTKYEMNDILNDGAFTKPRLIQEMINEAKLATYVVYHCCNIFVRYICAFIICDLFA